MGGGLGGRGEARGLIWGLGAFWLPVAPPGACWGLLGLLQPCFGAVLGWRGWREGLEGLEGRGARGLSKLSVFVLD